jgi:glycosyltransferase involved in cell wall biosynthesis
VTEAGGERATGISVCIVCRNEADRLGPCLASVGWADEIVMFDLSSSDRSADLAREHGARVVTRAPVPIVELVRNEVAAAASHDWILMLDPDERVTPGLARHLREVADWAEVDAVIIPFTNYDFGHPPSSPLHRYEPHLRFYRRSAVEWPSVPNKQPMVAEDRLHRVPYQDEFVIIHERNRNVPELLDRVVRYAPLQAQSMIDRGEIFSAKAMVENLGRRLYIQFAEGRAHRDGVPGIMRAATLMNFHFWVWASFWQLSGARRTPADDRYVRRLGSVIDGSLQAAELIRRPYRLALRVRGERAVKTTARR